MSNFFKNYISTLLFIFVVYFFYTSIDFYTNLLLVTNYIQFNSYSLENIKIYQSIIILYIILLIPFYKIYKDKSKARIILHYIIKKVKNFKHKQDKKETRAILALIVKGFFAPLMILWLTGHIFTMINNLYLSYNDINLISESFLLFFNKHFFWLSFSIILFADVLFFTIGYLIEIPKLNNKIKSVDSTILGWFVVLICYPPINSYTSNLIGWYSTEFPQFVNQYIHLSLNIFILILMGIYSWASISLGLKASNLTNRGIIKKGPYKYIRHPAYITKNLSWWIGGLPLLIGNIALGQYKDFFIVLFSLLAWSFIYYLRAITEERHLNHDKEYKTYKKEVPYKFIPKIF